MSRPPLQTGGLAARLVAAVVAALLTLLTFYALARLTLPLLKHPELDRPDLALAAVLVSLLAGLLLLLFLAARRRRKPRLPGSSDGKTDHPH
jgi:hypothetical protein